MKDDLSYLDDQTLRRVTKFDPRVNPLHVIAGIFGLILMWICILLWLASPLLVSILIACLLMPF